MVIGASGDYIGLLSFFAFALSVIAAVLAIDMFRLLRTGDFGGSWRVLIIASVIYALMQALRMAEFLDWKALNKYGLSQIAELMFALALAYAFYLQRKAFTDAANLRRREREDNENPDDATETFLADPPHDARDADWSQFGAAPSQSESSPVSPRDETHLRSEIERM